MLDRENPYYILSNCFLVPSVSKVTNSLRAFEREYIAVHLIQSQSEVTVQFTMTNMYGINAHATDIIFSFQSIILKSKLYIIYTH